MSLQSCYNCFLLLSLSLVLVCLLPRATDNANAEEGKPNSQDMELRGQWADICRGIRQGRSLLQEGEPEQALEQYRKGYKKLKQFHEDNPEWYSERVQAQLDYVEKRLNNLTEKDGTEGQSKTSTSHEIPPPFAGEERLASKSRNELLSIIQVQNTLLQRLDRRVDSKDRESTMPQEGANRPTLDEIVEQLQGIIGPPANAENTKKNISPEAAEAISELKTTVEHQQAQLSQLKKKLKEERQKKSVNTKTASVSLFSQFDASYELFNDSFDNSNKKANADHYIAQARKAEKRGHLDKAISNYETAARRDADAVYPVKQLARIASETDSSAKVQDYLEQAFERDPTDAVVLKRLGQRYLQQGKTYKALGMLGNYMDVATDATGKGHHLLGMLFREMGWNKGARRELSQAFAEGYRPGATAYNLALMCASEEPTEMEQAEEWLKKARQHNADIPNDVNSFFSEKKTVE